MPPAIIAAVIAAGGAIGGGLLGKSKTSTTTPQSPEYNALRDLLIARSTSKLQNPTGLPEGYETGGIRDINNVYDLINQRKTNSLTSRGLNDSPVAGAVTAAGQDARGGEISRFETSLPLLQQQLQNQDFQQALQLYQSRTPGVATTGPSNVAGGAFSSAASLLAYLYGSGGIGGSGSGAGGSGAIPGLPGGWQSAGQIGSLAGYNPSIPGGGF